MKFIELRCKNCKAKLVVDEDNKEATCNYCGTVFKIDDEVKHVQYDNMEQSGYEFEKGRIRAREEYKANKSSKPITVEPKKQRSIWFYLICFLFFPITLTYWIGTSKKLNGTVKAVLIFIVWIIFIFASVMSDYESDTRKKNKIIECYSYETYEKLDEVLGMDNVFGNFDEDTMCDVINLRSNGKKIDIVIDDDKLISIQVGDEYIYNLNEEEKDNVNQE